MPINNFIVERQAGVFFNNLSYSGSCGRLGRQRGRMDLLVVGMNHKTAPVEVRERFSFRSANIIEVNRMLKDNAFLDECLVLSTCNRVEIYASASHYRNHIKDIENFLGSFHDLDISLYRGRIYVYRDKEAVEHLFKVASGLDSMVIGEMEILRQVRQAYQYAREGCTTGKLLNRLFEKAFKASKEIRTETSITRGTVSVSALAVRLVRKVLGGLQEKQALVIGAGKVGEQLMLYLKKQGIGSIQVANRTLERARDLADRFGGVAVPFEDFRGRLPEMDIVITSTGAGSYIIGKDEILAVMSKRKKRPFFIIDLAVPRDVQAEVNTIDNVYLYDIDDLQKIVDETMTLRENELENCLKIISSSSEKFTRWLSKERLWDGE